jgi:putative DNA primase/helicase
MCCCRRWLPPENVAHVARHFFIKGLTSIRAGTYRNQVEQIRERFARALKRGVGYESAKKAVDKQKQRLPGVTFAGVMPMRAKKQVPQFTGLLPADLDLLGDRLPANRNTLRADPHVYALFVSPTGEGLKAIYRVPLCENEGQYKVAFHTVSSRVQDLCGVVPDELTDFTRLCFASCDPELYHNPAAIELPVDFNMRLEENKPEPPKPTNNNPVINGSTRREIVEKLLGTVEWESDTVGHCRCPGEAQHTTGEKTNECRVYLDGTPTVHCVHTSCAGIVAGVNRELRSRIGEAEIKQTAPWPDPKPLPADLPPVPPFNSACLPVTFREWIEDIAERMQCPPDFPAVGAMIAIGSVVGRKIGIRPKRFDDWLVIPNLWGFIVGRPGLMKTPALEQPLLPLRRLVAEALDRYAAEIREQEVNTMLDVQGAKLAEKKIAGLLKNGDQKAARAEAEAIAKKKSSEPVCRRYETNDPTIEKLGVLLAENPMGLLLFRDELVGFLRGLDRDGHESDRATYLETWNGTGSFTSDRIQRGTIRTPAVLSILGGIQPDLLVAYIREAVRGGLGADGLLQRFQVAVWPDVSKEWRHVDRWPNTEAKNRAFDVFKYLDELTPEAVGADTSSGIPFLRFTNDAQERFDLWRAELEATLRNDTEHPAFEAHLSKYRKLVPALALLIHLANRDTGPVTLAALNKAFHWANYLEAHAI